MSGAFTIINVWSGETIITGIDDTGHMVGYAAFQIKNFLRSPGGGVRTFVLPDSGVVFALNENKVMVGASTPGKYGFELNLTSHADTKLQFPGKKWTEFHGINGKGQIVGLYIDDATRYSHGFLRNP